MAEALTTRERLAALVEAMPGIHLRMAQRALRRSIGTIVYHVRALTQDGRIRRVRQGRYVRLYPVIPIPHGVSRRLARAFWRLSESSQRILSLLTSGPRRLVDVAARVGISKQLAHYHLRRMLAAGIVVVQRDRGAKLYALPVSRQADPSLPDGEGAPATLPYRAV